jgi:hypothetical protein
MEFTWKDLSFSPESEVLPSSLSMGFHIPGAISKSVARAQNHNDETQLIFVAWWSIFRLETRPQPHSLRKFAGLQRYNRRHEKTSLASWMDYHPGHPGRPVKEFINLVYPRSYRRITISG